MKKGGVLAGHDYLQLAAGPVQGTTFEVKAAVGDWMARNGYKVKKDLLLTSHDGFPSFCIRIR